MRGRHQRGDGAGIVEQYGQVVAETVLDQDLGVDQRARAHHTVSVTLFRCGGRSGLWPRRNASALIAR